MNLFLFSLFLVFYLLFFISQEVANMYDLVKRKRGAPIGNQNARTHGFYAKVLTPDEKRELKLAGGMDGLDQEIAILRIKLRALIGRDDCNLRLINQTAATLAKLYTITHSLGNTDTAKLKEAFHSVIAEFIIPDSPSPPK
jgi:hypothetical protein